MPQLKKALTVREPWGWLITGGEKTIENRTWSVNYRGPIAIHTSQTDATATDIEVYRYLESIDPRIVESLNAEPLPIDEEDQQFFHFGCVVGEVDLVDIVRVDEIDAAVEAGRLEESDLVWGGDSTHLWVMRNAKRYLHPLEMPGKTSLWSLSDKQSAVLERHRVELVDGGIETPALRPYDMMGEPICFEG